MRTRSMLRPLMLTLCLLPLAATASERVEAQLEPFTSKWQQVQSTIDSALAPSSKRGLGVYASRYGGLLHLGEAGGVVVEMPTQPDTWRSAMLGQATSDGDWLVLELRDMAIDPRSATPAMIALWEAQMQEAELEMAEWAAAQKEAEGEDAEAAPALAETDDDIDVLTDEDSEFLGDDEEEMQRTRLLSIPFGDGHLLLDEDRLMSTAQSWDGVGALKIDADYWSRRLRPEVDLAAGGSEDQPFAIEDPLNAGLPNDLRKLLRRDAVQTHAVEWLDDPTALKWAQHSAQFKLRLDRGSRHGVFEGTVLTGLPPHEGRYATVVEASADSSIATISVLRFHPTDPVELPPLGMTFTNRRVAGGACALDFSAPVRGKVLNASHTLESLDFDGDGYAWLELRIDQGASQGLAKGDRFYAEQSSLNGEGRVSAVESQQSTVLWRLHRYYDEMALELPQTGAALVTSAWRRFEMDLFPSAMNTQSEPVVEVIAD